MIIIVENILIGGLSMFLSKLLVAFAESPFAGRLKIRRTESLWSSAEFVFYKFFHAHITIFEFCTSEIGFFLCRIDSSKKFILEITENYWTRFQNDRCEISEIYDKLNVQVSLSNFNKNVLIQLIQGHLGQTFKKGLNKAN